MSEKPKSIKIDEVEYVRSDSITEPASSGRFVFVLDRGWIFAGDLSAESPKGRIQLLKAVLVQRWDGVGFDGMIADPKNKVTIKKMTSMVDFPLDCELFRVPVCKNWGL